MSFPSDPSALVRLFLRFAVRTKYEQRIPPSPLGPAPVRSSLPRPVPSPSQYKYTPAWRGHVLAHLPFYLILLPQFASLSLSRLKYRPDVALRDLDRVLAVLAAAGPELLRELRTAEAAYNDFLRPAAAGGRRRSEGEYGEMVPWWLEQVRVSGFRF